jgi:fatty acid-binding protein DegV
LFVLVIQKKRGKNTALKNAKNTVKKKKKREEKYLMAFIHLGVMVVLSTIRDKFFNCGTL